MECKSYELDSASLYVKGIPFSRAGSYSTQPFTPSIFLFHYTASTFESAEREFNRPESKKSIHFLVSRSGDAVQKVTLACPAWHAGAESRIPVDRRAKLKGFRFPSSQSVNFQSIGMELANEGPLSLRGDGDHYTWYGKRVLGEEVVRVDKNAPGAFGREFWHAYTAEQLETAFGIARAVIEGLDLKDVMGHSDVLNGKLDPGPLFPMKAFRSRLFGRDG